MDYPLLKTAATNLRKTIYASLPWAYRIAGVFMLVAEDATRNIGRGFYQMFRQEGDVTGMEARDLGDTFGRHMYGLALRITHSPEKAKDVLQELFAEYLAHGTFKKIHGDIGQAEAFVMNMVKNRALNMLRNMKRNVSLTQEDDEGESVERVIEDPDAWSDLDEGVIDRSDMPRVLSELRRRDPNLEAYFKAKLEGNTDAEILEGKLLPMLQKSDDVMLPSTFSMRRRKMLQDIGTVLQKYI